MPFPIPEWTPAGIIKFLQEQTSENKHFECKAFLNWDHDLNDFHSPKAATSYFTLRAIESIIAFANAEGGLLFLGIAESRAKYNETDCDGICIHGADGNLNFIITGIEPDEIGFINGMLDDDKYKLELQHILFPASKTSITYVERKSDKPDKKRQRQFPIEYQKNILLKNIELIPFYDEKIRKNRTVAIIQVNPSSEPIIIHEITENQKKIPLAYVRSAFNNNGPLEGDELRYWERKRIQSEKISPLAVTGKSLPPPKSKIEQVPSYFQVELATYTVPKIANEPIPDSIFANVKAGNNVFIRGDSGMGKSLLLSYCFLHGEFEQPAVFYSIDRTQGPDRYESAAILSALRELVQDQTNVRAVESPIPSPGKAPWVYDKEFFEKVLRTFRASQPNAKMVIFLDGLDENYQEGQDTEFILNILKSLIVDRSLGIIWVLSSQPRKDMEWLENHFTIVELAGLDKEQAEDLLQRQLPAKFHESFKHVLHELLERGAMESGLYDPEMTIISGRALASKLAEIRLLKNSEDILRPLLSRLPFNYREKYQWLFNQYLKNKFYTDVLTLLCLTRKPIPRKVLLKALALKDPDPRTDYYGEREPRFEAYAKPGDFELALGELQRFIKIVGEHGEALSFCKEAVREAARKFLPEARLAAAKLRLGVMADTDLSFLSIDNVEQIPAYLALETLFLWSWDDKIANQRLKDLSYNPLFPEWLQQRALKDPSPQWVPGFIKDLQLLRKYPLETKLREHLDLIIAALLEWCQRFDGHRDLVAAFLRHNQVLQHLWPEATTPEQKLLVPTGGYARSLPGHWGRITALAVLPDGRLASASEDETIRLWDLNTKASIVLEGHTGAVRCLVSMSDGRLASAGDDATIRIWDVSTGESRLQGVHELQIEGRYRLAYSAKEGTHGLAPFGNSINCLALFPHGRLVSGGKDPTIRIWDLEKNDCRIFQTDHAVSSLAVLSESQWLSFSGEELLYWDLTCDQPSCIKKSDELIFGNLFPNGFMAFPYKDYEATQFVNLAKLEYLVFNEFEINPTSLIILPDGKFALEKPSSREWDGDSYIDTPGAILICRQIEQELSIINRIEVNSTAMICMPDGRLCYDDGKGSIFLRNLENDNEVILPQGEVVTDLDRMPDGRLVIGSSDKTIRIQNITDGSVIVVEDNFSGNLQVFPDSSISYSLEGDIFCISNENKKRIVFERSSYDERYNFKFLTDLLLSCETRGSLIALDLNTLSCESLIPQPIKTYPFLPNIINFWGSFNSFADNYVFLSGLFEDTILNLKSGEYKIIQGTPPEIPRTILYHPGGYIILNDIAFQAVEVYNPKTGEKNSVDFYPEEIHSVAVLPDGRIAAGGKNIHIWDIPQDYDEQPDEDIFEGHTDFIWSMVVLPDGRLVSGSEDKTIRIWNLGTKDSRVFHGHKDTVTCLSVLPDGRMASGGADNDIRIWDIETGASQVLGSHSDQVVALVLLPDGRLASGGLDGTVRLWNLGTGTAEIIPIERGKLRSLAMLPDGRLGLGLDHTFIWLSNFESGEYRFVDDYVTSVDSLIALDDETLISYEKNRLHIYYLATNETSLLEGAASETNIIHLTKISVDSVAIAHEDGSLVLWNITTKVSTLLGRCESRITDLQVMGERYVVALSDDNTIQVFDLIHSAGILFNYQCENAISYLKAISPHCLVAACSDKTLRILDIFKGEVAVGFLEIVAKKLVFSPERKILWPVPMPQNFPGFDLSGYLN